jgi:chemotaxis protein MotB
MRFGTLALVLLLTGCGWKKTAEELQATLGERDVTISRQVDELAERDTTIDGLKANVVDLDHRIEVLQARILKLDADIDELQSSKADILADRGALAKEIKRTKAALKDLAERKRLAEDRVEAFQTLLSRFKSLIDSGTLDVRIVNGRMVVVLATDVFFASGSADLSDEGKDALTAVGQVLADISDRRFQIEGHTDNVPISTTRYPSNWYLAAGRAIGVVNHLIASGMDAASLSAASYGDTQPVGDNEVDDGRESNRRIEIVIVPDLSSLPGHDELSAIGK